MQWLIKSKAIVVIIIIIGNLILTACSGKDKMEKLLDPERPITITLWHYYNGKIKEEFDLLVSQFNETVGMEKGIVVESQSQGEVLQLETSLLEAANKAIGSAPMPDIFSSYADNAYQISQIINLVPLEKYFSEDELLSYRSEFMEEGKFLKDNKSYILPIAKATENLFVNETDWSEFADNNNFTLDDLLTWKSLYNVAQKYYEKTGNGFLGIDSTANFIIMFSKQYGEQIIDVDENGKTTFNFSKELARLIWDNYYDPHINGYYVKNGRFSSDDAKTGDIISFISSTSGARYFPKEVTPENQEVYAVKPLVLPYPSIDGKNLFAVQQGAGMCISESENVYEYASSIFLKWFTDTEQNMSFAVKSGYLPVKDEVYEKDLLIDELKRTEIKNRAMMESFLRTNRMLKQYELYSSKASEKSYELRMLLGTDLFNKIITDLEILTVREANGEDRKQVIKQLISDDNFNKWYDSINVEASRILK